MIFSLKKESDTVLSGLKTKIGHLINGSTVFIGTAGTITTLASIDIGLRV